MLIIFRREFKAYFLTPVGYIFLGMFLLLSGICFIIINLASHSCSMLYTLQFMGYIWMLLSPVLVMRLIAMEKHSGTDKLLFSSPCSITSIVAGKYLAACAVMLIGVMMTFVYVLIIAFYGHVYLAETLAGYAGFILQGMAYIAMDLFLSSIVSGPVSAAILCTGVNLFLWLADLINDTVSGFVPGKLFAFVSLYRRCEQFAEGRISLGDTVFFIVFILTMLFLCIRMLDMRRWSHT